VEDLSWRPGVTRTPPERRHGRDALVEWLRAQPDQKAFVRECYLDSPPAAAAERFSGSEEWSATLKKIGRCPGDALDIGGGHGIASYALARNGWRVVSLEPSAGSVTGATAIKTLAKAADLPIEVLRGVGESLPFHSTTFDVVYSRQVLHHVADLPRFCGEVWRVLRPGGVYLAAGEHIVSSESQRLKFLRAHPLNRFTGDENAYRLGHYLRGFDVAGFCGIEVMRSFDSAINFAPYSTAALRDELRRRMSAIPGGRLFADWILSERLYPSTLRFLSRIDRRPGRVFSFLAMRPAEADRG
jgi:SAM-dependent methyltransferase